MSVCRHARLIAAIMPLVVLVSVVPVGAADAPILATSSGQYIWFVLPDFGTPPETALFLHAADSAGSYRERLRVPLPGMPVRMAAWGSDLWMIFPDRKSGYEVFTIRVEREPNLGAHLTLPRDRLAMEAPIAESGGLRSFVATPGGPVALMVSDSGPPGLLQLRGGRWQAFDPPPSVDSMHALFLVAVDRTDAISLIVVEGAAEGLVVHERDAEGGWRRSVIAGAVDPLIDVTAVGGRPVVISRPAPDRVAVSYLRLNGLLPLAVFDEPRDGWIATGLSDGLRILTSTPAGVVSIRRIDPITGKAEPSSELKPPPVPTFQILQGALFLAIAVVALLIVIVFRPEKRSTVSLPPGLEPVPPIPRLLALAVDLIPGGVLTLLILRVPPSELASLPMLTADPSDAMAYLLMVTLTVLHTTLFEMVGGASIGKLLFGARVVGNAGERPTTRRLLIRGVLKFVVLLIPPLAVLALFNPNLQGVGDIVARTTVVQERDPNAPSDSE